MKASKIGAVYLMHKGTMVPLQAMPLLNSRKLFKKPKGPKVKINKKK